MLWRKSQLTFQMQNLEDLLSKANLTQPLRSIWYYWSSSITLFFPQGAKTLQSSTFSYFLLFPALFYQFRFHGQLLKYWCFCLFDFLPHISTCVTGTSLCLQLQSLCWSQMHTSSSGHPLSFRPTQPTFTKACQPQMPKTDYLIKVCSFCWMFYLDDKITPSKISKSF